MSVVSTVVRFKDKLAPVAVDRIFDAFHNFLSSFHSLTVDDGNALESFQISPASLSSIDATVPIIHPTPFGMWTMSILS